MRVYLALTVDELTRLVGGESFAPAEAFIAASEDEEDELAALEEAADHGAVAAAAEVADPDQAVELSHIESFHLDVDGTGDLAWYATQEAGAVLRAVKGAGPTSATV